MGRRRKESVKKTAAAGERARRKVHIKEIKKGHSRTPRRKPHIKKEKGLQHKRKIARCSALLSPPSIRAGERYSHIVFRIPDETVGSGIVSPLHHIPDQLRRSGSNVRMMGRERHRKIVYQRVGDNFKHIGTAGVRQHRHVQIVHILFRHIPV